MSFRPRPPIPVPNANPNMGNPDNMQNMMMNRPPPYLSNPNMHNNNMQNVNSNMANLGNPTPFLGRPPPFGGPPNMSLAHHERPPFMNNAAPYGPLPPLVRLPPGWFQYFTPDGLPYYHHPATNQTLWQVPGTNPPPNANSNANDGQNDGEAAAMNHPEMINKQNDGENELEKSNSTPPPRQQPPAQTQNRPNEKPVSMKLIEGTSWKLVTTNLNGHYYYNPTTKVSTWTIPEEVRIHQETVERAKIVKAAEEVKKKIDEQQQERQPDNEQQQSHSRSVSPSNEDAASGISDDERKQKFIELLRDCKVSAFSTWEKELPKIATDPRYTMVKSLRERKAVFENYCKNRIHEETVEKKQQLQQERNKYEELVKEWLKQHRGILYEDFVRKSRNDPRAKYLDPKEREKIFNQIANSQQQSKKGETEKAKKDFIALLKQTKEIKADSRYEKVKRYIEKDDRYHAVNSSSLREDLFDQYIKDLSEEQKRIERERREERSVAEREREVKREMFRRKKEQDDQLEHLKKEEGMLVFNTLLVDHVTSHENDWDSSFTKMKSDPRYQLQFNPDNHSDNQNDKDIDDDDDDDDRRNRHHNRHHAYLSTQEMRKLFEKHVDNLFQKRKAGFYKLLEEVIGDEIEMKWEEVKRDHSHILVDEPRFTRLSANANQREKLAIQLYNDFQKERRSQAEIDLIELLKESKFISYLVSTHRGQEDVIFGKMEQVLDSLSADKRYLIFNNMTAFREETIRNFIKDLAGQTRLELEKRAKIETGVLKDH